MEIATLDQVTFIVAVIVVGLKIGMRAYNGKQWLVANKLGKDFLNGGVIVPFGVMIAALFNASLFKEMTSASTLSVALAGGIGLFFLFEELKSLD